MWYVYVKIINHIYFISKAQDWNSIFNLYHVIIRNADVNMNLLNLYGWFKFYYDPLDIYILWKYDNCPLMFT